MINPSPAPDLTQLDRWLAEDVGGRFEVGPCRFERGGIAFDVHYAGEGHIKFIWPTRELSREYLGAILNATEAALKHRQAARQ